MTATKILGTVISLLLAVIGWIGVTLSNKVDAISQIQSSRGERISSLEANMVFIKQALERIERKLDK